MTAIEPVDAELVKKVHTFEDESGDAAPRPITSLAEYDMIMARLQLLEGLADDIANVLCDRRADFDKFTADGVVYEYNNSCSCHPEECHGEFPAAYLFDPDWEKKRNAEIAEAAAKAAAIEKAKKEKAAAAAAAKREREELEQYKRLKEKYEPDAEV